MVIKTASDFVGSAVGESETKTAAIISLCQGKVLLIDECYNLDDNMYGKKVLDTFVEKISGQGSEVIAVLMVGYEQPIRTMLRNQNPGLSSRFDPAEAFLFEDYSSQSLLRILERKVDKIGLLAHHRVLHAALDKLVEKKSLPRFGNAREVDNLISVAQGRASVRATAATAAAAAGAKTVINLGKLRLEVEDVVVPPEEQEKARGDAIAALDALCNIDGIRKKLKSLCDHIELTQKEGRPKPKLSNMVSCGCCFHAKYYESIYRNYVLRSCIVYFLLLWLLTAVSREVRHWKNYSCASDCRSA